jgi:hypothetical protein
MRDIGQQSQYQRTDLTGVDDKLSLVAAVGIMTSKATCFDYPSQFTCRGDSAVACPAAMSVVRIWTRAERDGALFP